MKNWKSTLSGGLSLFIAIGAVFTSTASDKKLPAAFTIAMGVAKAVIGWIQVDAGTTLAVVEPGSPAVPVPSHELPDDPRATPVK